MANVIKLHKGLDINLKGKAEEKLATIPSARLYAIIPDDFTGIAPKVVVKEQETIKAGGPLFVDKNHPELKIVSPVSGVVKSVVRGERRKLLSIIVEADEAQESVDFGKKNVNAASGEEVKASLLEAGLFAFFRQRPYDVVADVTQQPKAIFVSAFDSAPLAPAFEFVLKGQETEFQTGLTALSKMAKTYLGISAKQKATALTAAKDVDVNVFDGPHPAGNVGVQINHVSPVSKGETVWAVDPQTVIAIGRFFLTGKTDLTRIVAVVGSEVKAPAYVKMKVGEQVSAALKDNVSTDKALRVISGNPLSGKKIDADSFLGAFNAQITVIPEGTETNEMLGWIMPRFKEYSTSHSYFSWLLGKKEYTIDARVKGSERHMIMSGEYDRVFPMDIYPEYLVKAIIAGDIDRMEALGIYEVAPEDFALCEFVDSSKVEVQRIVRQGLDMLRKEMA